MNTTKIIKGVVNGGRYTVTAPIVKEDYGLYLQIEGVELPQTYEVDFSNSEHNGTSVTMIGNADGVLIPHQFIDTGKDVFAFLYHVGANYGKTVYKFRIPNKCRPDRTEEEPTPEEQSVIDQAISALNEAVAQTAQDVIDADASAQSASADAERAGEARTDAQNYATQAEQARDDAQTYANNASASATASANSASASAQIKADVEDLVDDAQGYANASAQSASASANSASQAQGYAQSASASAQSASGYASNAQTSANTASNKASEASTSAQTASNKASEASQSASQALSYKTDAESAKTASQTAQGLAESARDSAISAQESAEDARDEAQNLVDGISGKVEQIDANTASVASLEEDRYKPYATDTASGSIASFTDGADDIPLKSLVVNIDPVQEGTGDPSPDNVRPISGWTGCNVNANGTVIPISWESEAGTVYGGTLDVVSGVLTVDKKMVTIDGSNYALGVLRNVYNNRYCYRNTYLGGITEKNLPSEITKACCNILKSISRSDATSASSGIFQYHGDNDELRFLFPLDDAYSTPDKIYALGLECCIPLATPLTYQLSAQEIKSLYGQNNIFADTGDTTAEYRADTKAYIAKKIAEAISALS